MASTSALLRCALAVLRARPASRLYGGGLRERRLRWLPAMDGDRVEIDGGIMEGVNIGPRWARAGRALPCRA